MAEAVYILCAVTSFACAVLLLRTYLQSRVRLLLWSSICFLGLALNNALVYIDWILVQDTDLSMWRLTPALLGVTILLYGLIWDAE